MSNNSSTENNHDSSSDTTFFLVYNLILAFIVAIVILINGIVVLIYCYVKTIRSKTANLLLCNQALVDIFNGAVPGVITLLSAHSPLLVTAAVYQFSIALSFHTVVLISVERYVFILKPLFHRRCVTKSRMTIVVLASWILSVLWIPARLVHYDDNNQLVDENNELRSSFCLYVAISNGIILSVMICVGLLHGLTYAEVRRHIKNRQGREGQSAERIKREHLKEMRVSRIFIAMFIAFVVTYTPLIVTGIVHIVGGFQSSDYKYTALDVLFYFVNSLFNPGLTLIYKEDYRKVVHKFKRRFMETVFSYSIREGPSCSSTSDDDIVLTQVTGDEL